MKRAKLGTRYLGESRVSFVPHVSVDALDTCEGPGTRSD